MHTRGLGRSGLRVPPVVFGGNVFGWTVDKAASFRLLDALVEAGLNAVDTADVYSAWVPGHAGGESEAIIGEWLRARGRRHDVVVLTKVGMEMPGQGGGLSAAWIARAVEGSLGRLGTDVIDLYQAHKDDGQTPLEETLGAFARLIEQGKVRAIGASNYDAPRLRAALEAVASVAARAWGASTGCPFAHGDPRPEAVRGDHLLGQRAHRIALRDVDGVGVPVRGCGAAQAPSKAGSRSPTPSSSAIAETVRSAARPSP